MENKPLYDKRINLDISHFPKELQDIINKLEQFKSEEWLDYDLLFEELDIRAKMYMNANKISRAEYEKILNKYGWLYD